MHSDEDATRTARRNAIHSVEAQRRVSQKCRDTEAGTESTTNAAIHLENRSRQAVHEHALVILGSNWVFSHS
jgi:hypothetical protein